MGWGAYGVLLLLLEMGRMRGKASWCSRLGALPTALIQPASNLSAPHSGRGDFSSLQGDPKPPATGSHWQVSFSLLESVVWGQKNLRATLVTRFPHPHHKLSPPQARAFQSAKAQ